MTQSPPAPAHDRPLMTPPAPTKGTTMARTTSTKTNTDLPAAWGTDAEELETRILVDKETLIGKPMKILGYEIERNDKRGYDVLFAYALDTDGNEFTFADTTDTGIKGQIQKAAAAKGLDPAAGAGFQALPLIVMGGLRVSDYEVAEGKNAGQRARTYYLEGKAKSAQR